MKEKSVIAGLGGARRAADRRTSEHGRPVSRARGALLGGRAGEPHAAGASAGAGKSWPACSSPKDWPEASRDRDKARARVNRLMREVDKCIALLESQPSEHSSRGVSPCEGAAGKSAAHTKRKRSRYISTRRPRHRGAVVRTRAEAMGKQAIKLRIMGKPYAFNIDSEKEEMYRLAEREVNDNLVKIRQEEDTGVGRYGLPGHDGLALRHRKRGHETEPRGGKRRPEGARSPHSGGGSTNTSTPSVANDRRVLYIPQEKSTRIDFLQVLRN